MPNTAEKGGPGACVIFDVPAYSRDLVTVLANNTIKPNAPVGRIYFGTATSAAGAGNTGNGTMGTVTPGTGTKVGVYRVVFIEPITNLGTFLVEDPTGLIVGRGFVGTAFAGGGLGFTIADGATDFVAGDQFLITVAAGSGKYVPLNPLATDGSEVCAGVAYDGVKAAAAVDAKGVVIVRHAKLNSSEIDWGTLSAPQIATATAQLLALGILTEAGI
jgi:hypothetical protein